MNKSTTAKKRGNRVHQQLKVLALQWVKRNAGAEVVEKLRKMAKRKVREHEQI